MNTKIISILLLASPLFALAEDANAVSSAPESVKATCPVSGEELGEMGKPYEYSYKVEGQPDQKVLLCCKHCVAKFEKDPAKYLKDQAPKAKPPASDTDAHNGHSH